MDKELLFDEKVSPQDLWDRASFHVANPPSPQFCRTDETGQIAASKEAPKRFSTRVSKYFRYCRSDHQMFPRNFFHVYCFTLVSVNKSRQMATVKGGDVCLCQVNLLCVCLFAGNAWSWNYKLDSCPSVMSFVSHFWQQRHQLHNGSFLSYFNESHENNTKSTWASFLFLKCVVLLSPSNQLGFKQSNHLLLKIIQNASLLSKQLQQS